jgi:hypothetical protein
MLAIFDKKKYGFSIVMADYVTLPMLALWSYQEIEKNKIS